VILALGLAAAAQVNAAGLEFQKGDHVCIVGNTLADRMQHDGWLETLLQSRLSEHELVIRNLGFSGDEVAFRMRSDGFGSPEQHLARHKADVVIAMFGYNESFAGAAGVEKFKADLVNFIRATKKAKYNGHSETRIALCSPIAHEDLGDPNLPDGKENNVRLKLYTEAMRSVADAEKVAFVDLFAPTLAEYARKRGPLTINGIHLNERGNRFVSEAIVEALLAGTPRRQPLPSAEQLEKLRAAVLDKNFYWFNRYRTVDGYSIYGGRADLRFVDGQTNRVVMQREMEVLDTMTANRDAKIWAVARGSDLKVDDSNTPPFIPVKTNKPGPLPGGKHIFIGGDAAIKQMTLAKGLKVNLFASEEMFPEMVNPVQMAFDTKGRLWVAAWQSYPHWKPKEVMNDKLLILEDTDGDGRADKCKTFAGGLHNPTGFEFYGGGVLVAMAPDILFLQDTDGDDVADVRKTVISGMDSADTHHTSNSFTIDPGGALYYQEGTFMHTQVETPYGPTVRCANAGVYRYEPKTQKFDVYVSYPFANPHGHAFDRWGQDIVIDGTGSDPYHGTLFSGHVNFPNKHGGAPHVYQQWTRPCPGIEFVSSRHFPDSMQGNLLVGNVITYQGILQYKISDDGSSLHGEEAERLLSSSDPNFRPTDLEFAPDGSLYFSDWQNPIIGHMQHNLRDPSRDREHGRVYRVTYEGRPLIKPAVVAGQPIDKLLDLLKEPESRLRYRVKIELSARNSDEVMAATDRWLAALDTSSPDYEHNRLEALWMHQYHNRPSIALLDAVLASKDFRARAAAVRVLCMWRDRVPGALERVKKLAADEAPRVRLEAVRAASFFTSPDAVEVALIAAELPRDQYLDYTSRETQRTLEPIWKAALARGETIAVTSDAGARFFLANMSTEALLKGPKNRAVYLEMLYRPGLQDDQRRLAVRGLAGESRQSEMAVLLDAVRKMDAKNDARDESVIFDLLRLLTSRGGAELTAARGELEKLALSAKQAVIRQIAFVTLIAVDGSADKAWTLAAGSPAALRDFTMAVPLIADGGVRADLFSKIEPLLTSLPGKLASGAGGKATPGRYVRIELSGNKTLTLAEVEIFSGGKNVARGGKARQRNTAFGGAASRAIDGNKSGDYSGGGQTHSVENTRDPWWEVDLGDEYPIDGITIYTRTDGEFYRRLDGFTVRVLDAARNETFALKNQPAPRVKAEIALEAGGTEGIVRRAAMTALVSMRGKEAQTFHTLARFVRDDVDRPAATRALLKIPRSQWPKEEAAPLAAAVLKQVGKIEASQRTQPAALDALELADGLARLLPADEGKRLRAEIGELGVRVIRMGTLLERMSYDKDSVAVKAGKNVEFLFENSDMMPHNLVILRPGTLEATGKLAEATGQQPEAAARDFVPQSPAVLMASRLIQPRQSQKVSFVAPKEPGVYPYVCTYPGHWRRMYGALYVVEDLDAYQANPEAYLAAHPLPIRDELLKDRRPRTEWKLEDLASAVEHIDGGRSYANGKHLFQVASCVGCHRLDNTGAEFGPDLLKLDVKLAPVDLLKDVLEPSSKINEKYQQRIVRTTSGVTHTGLLVKETPAAIELIENPLVSTKSITIARDDVDEMVVSKVSMMPKGLLDKLTREEVLDLVAYIACRGDKRHKMFQGEMHDHAHPDGTKKASANP
jgi:putative heme-binding domain-containing protein